MNYYSTPEVARMLHVSKGTLYNWQRLGILLPALKTPTGRFYYSEEQVIQMREKIGYDNSECTPEAQPEDSSQNVAATFED